MERFELDSYTALAEDVARKKRSAAQLLVKMQAEAARLEGELATALFKPYVGKHITVDYNKTATLFRRQVQDWRSKTPGLLPVYDDYLAKLSPADRKALASTDAKAIGWQNADRTGGWHGRERGWMAIVRWDEKLAAHIATLMRAHDDHFGEKSWYGAPSAEVAGFIPDIGSQAIVLAKALAQEIGERLVI